MPVDDDVCLKKLIFVYFLVYEIHDQPKCCTNLLFFICGYMFSVHFGGILGFFYIWYSDVGSESVDVGGARVFEFNVVVLIVKYVHSCIAPLV